MNNPASFSVFLVANKYRIYLRNEHYKIIDLPDLTCLPKKSGNGS